MYTPLHPCVLTLAIHSIKSHCTSWILVEQLYSNYDIHCQVQSKLLYTFTETPAHSLCLSNSNSESSKISPLKNIGNEFMYITTILSLSKPG